MRYHEALLRVKVHCLLLMLRREYRLRRFLTSIWLSIITWRLSLLSTRLICQMLCQKRLKTRLLTSLVVTQRTLFVPVERRVRVCLTFLKQSLSVSLHQQVIPKLLCRRLSLTLSSTLSVVLSRCVRLRMVSSKRVIKLSLYRQEWNTLLMKWAY